MYERSGRRAGDAGRGVECLEYSLPDRTVDAGRPGSEIVKRLLVFVAVATDNDSTRSPDTESVSRGHDPAASQGSLKSPIFETSAFVFGTAEEGKRFFEVTYGLDQPDEGEEVGFIYSRLDNPNLRVAEERMSAWEGTEDSLVFSSGMAAIFTVLFSLLRPGDLIAHSSPLYGGTTTVIGLLSDWGVESVAFGSEASEEAIEEAIGSAPGRLAIIYLETPANPTNDIFDIAMAAGIAAKARDGGDQVRLVVDNTFLSPVGQRPVHHGADLVVQSATKYLGGHSDLTAGMVSGNAAEIERLRRMRYRLGTTASPNTAWLLSRSLETLRLRVDKQTANATAVAAFLEGHPKVASVSHLSLLGADDPRRALYERQCSGPGGMISFEVMGGEEEAFGFLNAMNLVRLAVSLGGTESIASHPWSMSHSTVSPEDKKLVGVTEGLIRLSVGVEDADDLIEDLGQALSRV